MRDKTHTKREFKNGHRKVLKVIFYTITHIPHAKTFALALCQDNVFLFFIIYQKSVFPINYQEISNSTFKKIYISFDSIYKLIKHHVESRIIF